MRFSGTSVAMYNVCMFLPQTNVYPSAQRRKLREFSGYRRIAAVVVVNEEDQRQRAAAREAADGKEVPDAAILDMKGMYHTFLR